MIRRLLIPLAASALLAGCVTSPQYGYRADGHGDYYYGAPYVDYRYHYDSWPYYGFGYPYYYGPYRSGFSFWGHYGYGGYGGYYPYYGGAYYGQPYRYNYPNYRPRPRPDGNHGGNGHPGDRGDNRDGDDRLDGAPWRHPDQLARRRHSIDNSGGMVRVTPQPQQPSPPPQVFRPGNGSARRGGDDGGSAMGDMIRHARRDVPVAENEP